ncbi:MAG: hypothetical protein EXS36_01615 [Pedosphaera sp.]|nr:hypothetical protein [Pedosphaera sp.]
MTKEQPLSEKLRALVSEGGGRGLTLNRLLERTGAGGHHLLVILLALPFTTPIPLPGLSTVLGAVILFLAGRAALGLPLWLPLFLGGKSIPADRQQGILNASLKLLKWLEKLAKPRYSTWVGSRGGILFHHFLILVLASLLLLPLPIPFSNTLPAYGIILITASLLESDGALIWLGDLVALLAICYVAGILVGGAEFSGRIWTALHALRPQ